VPEERDARILLGTEPMKPLDEAWKAMDPRTRGSE
jgi:hypothetical protein